MIDLTARQLAGERVERAMLEFLMQFIPARELKVSDVQTIAAMARSKAFEAFSEVE
jgi:hypothetical protein